MGSAFLSAYPHMAKARTVDGYNLGWTTQRLICGDDEDRFIVESIGLDTAVRGANIEFQRPDFIMPGDLDSLHDSPYLVEKNIETLTKSILLAGSSDKVVLGLQNLIHQDSIFAQIADGRAKFLTNRYVSGPVPALEGDFQYEERETENGRRFVIVSGEPTWEDGFGLEQCEKELNDVGPAAFAAECQHDVAGVREDATFREFNPVFHFITTSEFMRYFVGNHAHRDGLQPFNAQFIKGMASRLSLPRGVCAMAQDWGSTLKHPCATHWIWKPGEGVPLTDSLFFLREMCWPSFPPVNNDPRANPSYGQLHKAILEVEKQLGISSQWNSEKQCVEIRLMSYERPEASAAYLKDYQSPLYFKPIDVREAKEGILHLQELLHVDTNQFHPFRIDPRTLKSQPLHNCKICGWEHSGLNLNGRPRALFVVADGQGELTTDQRGKLQAKPATDELGMPRTRFEYPKYRPAETS